MKQTFLKIGLFAALGFTTAVFYSCKDGDKGSFKITAPDVIDGSTQIVTVKAFADDDVIAQASYRNNSFALALPATLDAKYLGSITEGLPEEVTVSDASAKVFFLYDIRGYNANDDEIGDFYLEAINGDEEYYASWMYADKAVTVQGTYEETDGGDLYVGIYDVQLKKGWNVVYQSVSYDDSTETETDTITSQKPSGINFAWNFYSNGFYAMATKSVENETSAFTKLKKSSKSFSFGHKR